MLIEYTDVLGPLVRGAAAWDGSFAHGRTERVSIANLREATTLAPPSFEDEIPHWAEDDAR